MCPHLVIDNFLDDPDAYRAKALSLDYYTVKGQADGGSYRDVSVVKTHEHKAKIEAAIGKKIDQDYSFCRRGLYASSLGAVIHADSGISPLACVLYLNTNCQIPEGSGTAYYRHKRLKIEKIPTEKEIRGAGKSPTRLWNTLEESWNDETAWEETGRVEMRYNRAVIFPTVYFHSRLPLEGFGVSHSEARLIFVSFFKEI